MPLLHSTERFLVFQLQDEHNASLKFNMCAGGISTAQRQRYEKFWNVEGVVGKKFCGQSEFDGMNATDCTQDMRTIVFERWV